MNSILTVLDPNHGSGHPIVARLMLQPSVLMQGFGLPEAERQPVAEVLMQCARYLLHCDDLAIELSREIAEAHDANRALAPVGGVIRLATVGARLNPRVEDFLENFKNCDRDSKALFGLFGNPAIGTLPYDQVASLFERDAGLPADHPLGRLLRNVEPRIRELLRKRNAKAHPGGNNGGVLTIHDFSIVGGVVIAPRWHRNDDPPSPLAPALYEAVELMFNYVELAFTYLLGWRFQLSPLVIDEIPTQARDPLRPERFRLTLRDAVM